MSSARKILLEVKRRLGDVNAVVPDETDLLAYLNSALRGIWNYAVEIESPRIEMTESATCGAAGSVELEHKPIRVASVLDTGNNRLLMEMTPRSAAIAEAREHKGMFGYSVCLDGIQIYQSADSVGGNLKVAYFPEYEDLETRDEDLPFASSIDDVVIAWTVKLITDGRSVSVSDMSNAAVLASSLVQYFEGHSEENYCGCGPW